MNRSSRVHDLAVVCVVLLWVGAAGTASAAPVELTSPSFTVRGPTLSGGTRLDMSPAVPGTVGAMRATIGQSSPLGVSENAPPTLSLDPGFWPMAAMVDCADPGDVDCDGIPNALDNCPYFNTADTTDTDGNGIGDLCECGDQNEDATVNVLDILAINNAIFAPATQTPLCDTNNDRECDVLDILGANNKIFGADAFCRRFPAPAPVP